MENKNVRITAYITPKLDDQLDDVAELMGLSKQDLFRFALSTVLLSYKTGVTLLRDEFTKKGIKKNENISL